MSFHLAQHTWATLLLYDETDLYTVSKILEHTPIKTTQVYVKVANEMKRKAVGNIPDVTICSFLCVFFKKAFLQI